MPFDAESFRAAVEGMMGADAFLVLVAGEPVHGMLIGFVQPALVNRRHLQASEIVWWVDESARKTGAGMALLREFLRQAKARGAESVTVTRQVTLEPERVGAIYRRMGFRPTDVTYVTGESWAW